MFKQRRVEKDSLIVTHFGGRHTYHDALTALRGLLELNAGNKHIYEIVINDDLKLYCTEQEEKMITSKIISTFGQFERGALSVVSNSNYVFGLTRMLTAT
ncbi:MAG: hypothetical protein JSV13_02680 [Nitrospiraceae bacterium]|nr:MAG: hypothetical protein JSV13_02680 [Nitrospiraceae bacterium]